MVRHKPHPMLWTQGGVKDDSHFCNLWSLWLETICHPFACIRLASIILKTMLRCKDVREKGKVWALGSIRWRTGGVNLLIAVSCPHCFLCLDRGFHFHSPDVDECADPRTCPKHSTCHNSLGSYSCACNPGFESSRGKMSFQGLGETCEGRFMGLLGNQVQSVCKDSGGGGGFEVGLSWIQSPHLQSWSQ